MVWMKVSELAISILIFYFANHILIMRTFKKYLKYTNHNVCIIKKNY